MNDDEKSLVIDNAEAGLDVLLHDGLLKEIPYLKTIYTLSHTLVTLRDRLFAAKIRRFVARAAEMTNDEKQRLAAEIEKEPKRKAALTEIVLLSIERTDRLKKAEILAVLFRAVVRGEISDLEFDQLAHAVNQADLHFLFEFLNVLEKDKDHNPRIIRIGFESLISSGIIRSTGTMSPDSSGTFTRATDLGLKLFQLLRNEPKGSNGDRSQMTA